MNFEFRVHETQNKVLGFGFLFVFMLGHLFTVGDFLDIQSLHEYPSTESISRMSAAVLSC